MTCCSALSSTQAQTPAVVRGAVEAVLPGEVVISTERATRARLGALQVREGVLATFALLALVRAVAHAVTEEEVHLHEAGAWNSAADVVGLCAALADLGVQTLTSGSVGLGSGTVQMEHGVLPVPTPAALRVLRGSLLVVGDEEVALRGSVRRRLGWLCSPSAARPSFPRQAR